MGQKIIMLKGLPGCGKSTYAKEIMKTSQGYIRVNKDLLREMMNFTVWTPDNEIQIKEAQLEVVLVGLEANKNVIIDDTNLGDKYEEHWRQVAENHVVDFEVIDLMDGIDVKECLKRNLNRTESLPLADSIIKRLAKEHGYK